MVDFINSIDVFGDDVVVDSIIDRSIQEYHDDTIKMVGNRTFYGCTSLTSVSVPMATTIGQGAFYKCSSIISMDLPSATSIGSYAFQGCSLLTRVILRNSSQMVSSSYPSFGGTPIVLGTGYIYVPSALIDSYKADSNWSKYANQFRILEEWTVDGTITGELDLVNRHMVRFFNSDGTLLGYKIVHTGEDASYDDTPVCPEKSSAVFKGFSPPPTNVTMDIDCYAQYFSFATLSWSEIAEISESGMASEYFDVGDTRTITMNFSDTTEDIKIRIIGFNHDDLSDGSGKAGISIALAQGLANNIFVTEENGYIWETSKTRELLNSGTVYYALPSELRAVIKAVTKTSNAGHEYYGGRPKNQLYTTADKVWLPSSTEIGLDNAIESTYVALNQGKVYEYYATNSEGRRKMLTTDFQYAIYATRSMQAQYIDASVGWHGKEGYVYVSRLGTSYTSGIHGRMFGFCI